MSISQKIEKNHKNQIKNIKNEKNRESKMKQIGVLVLDLGKRSINAVSKACNCSWRYVKKCFNFVNGIHTNTIETRGIKLLKEKYPDLIQDITKIIEDYLSIDPHFKSEKQYVKLTVKQIKKLLIETGKYNDKSFSNSYLSDLINKLGYGLKKVQKVKPLKKIAETDEIFENVRQKKEEAKQDPNTALISIDTKDKVLIVPFSRKGKNRIEIQAVDHELTNNCLIPFGILDMKRHIPYFFNYTEKTTSLNLVDCIEEFYKEQYLNTDVNNFALKYKACLNTKNILRE